MQRGDYNKSKSKMNDLSLDLIDFGFTNQFLFSTSNYFALETIGIYPVLFLPCTLPPKRKN